MATGDTPDMVRRMRAVLPAGWFPDDAPILTAILSGIGATWAWAFSLIGYAAEQTRIRTATDMWLDLIAQDYFGGTLPRKPAEGDAAFRNRILASLLPARGTRPAMIAVLKTLTGQVPHIFIPAYPQDTGGYGTGGIGYNDAGGYGSMALPFQAFITAYRPVGGGVANVNGYGGGLGGYGGGAIEYASLNMVLGQITDADIYAAVAATMPAGAIGWTHII